MCVCGWTQHAMEERAQAILFFLSMHIYVHTSKYIRTPEFRIFYQIIVYLCVSILGSFRHRHTPVCVLAGLTSQFGDDRLVSYR